MSKILFTAKYIAVSIGISVLSLTSWTSTASATPEATFEYESATPEILKERLQNIEGDFDFQYSSQIRNYIRAYTNNYRAGSARLLGRVTIYFPIFEDAIRSKGLPQELKYLSIIESNLNPNAKSKSGAVGLWQFMYRTAEVYDLEMNGTVDERRDPHKSTDAALSYLAYLYDQFDDWTLAIAAYNCGPGNMRKAIRKAGSKDFWKLRPFLPKETQAYVPKFIAASYFMNYYHAHDISIAPVSEELQYTETAKVYNKLGFDEISNRTGIPMTTIKQLNPSFLKNYIPDTDGRHLLTLPEYSMHKLMSEDSNLRLLSEYVNVIVSEDSFEMLTKESSTKTTPVITKTNSFSKFNSVLVLDSQEDEINLNLTEEELPKVPDNGTDAVEVKAIIERKEIKKPKYEFYRLNKKESIYDVVKKREDVSLDEILKINTFSLDDPPQPGTIIKVKQL